MLFYAQDYCLLNVERESHDIYKTSYYERVAFGNKMQNESEVKFVTHLLWDADFPSFSV